MDLDCHAALAMTSVIKRVNTDLPSVRWNHKENMDYYFGQAPINPTVLWTSLLIYTVTCLCMSST